MQLFGGQIVQRPFLNSIERLRQPLSRFLRPFRKCGQKTIELELEQFFRFPKTRAFAPAEIPQLSDGFEANFSVAHIGDELSDLAQGTIFAAPDIGVNFARCEMERRSRLFQMGPGLVDWRAVSILFDGAGGDRSENLVTDDPANPFADRFTPPQLVGVSHRELL
jgi:hypothetical protein